jgi:hypothetical protein
VGANAVNGIVNIITKPGAATQELYVTGGGGSHEQASGSVRYGAARGPLHYRGYFKSFDREDSSIDLPRGWSADAFVRHVSSLPAGAVPGYTTVNARVGVRITPQFEAAIVGQDLGQAHHLEWPSTTVQVERSCDVRLTWMPR